LKSNKATLVSFCFGVVLFWIGLYLFVPILSVYARNKGASLELVGLIVGSYGLTQLILRIPLGITSDRLGWRKPFVLGGFVVLILSCLGLAWAPTPQWVLIFRGLSGAAASVWVAVTVLFAGFFPKDKAVQATSILTFLTALGQLIGTSAGGWVADQWGWQMPFWGGAALTAIGILFTLPIHETRTPAANRLTWQRFLHVATVPTLILVSLLAALDQYAFHSTLQGFIPLYATQLGASKAMLGYLSTATMIPATLISLLAAVIAPRIGERRAIGYGLLMTFATTFVVPWVTTIPTLLLVRALYGLGRGLVYPVTMALSIKSVQQEERASAMGIFQAVYAIGMFAGPAINGLVAQRFGMSWVFWSTALLCLAAAIPTLLSTLRKRPQGQRP
jgi:MFS family permease